MYSGRIPSADKMYFVRDESIQTTLSISVPIAYIRNVDYDVLVDWYYSLY